MNSDELSPPSAKQPKLVSTCEISKLADADLSAIFKHLPLVDRLLISEVCKRWYAISKQAWLEITHLDLSPIPGPNIAPIVSLCPNLRNVSAFRKTFDVNELRILSRISLSSLKLYECKSVNLPSTDESIADPLATVFSSNLQNASLDELVLRDLELFFEVPARSSHVDFPASFPASLKRLQLSTVSWSCGEWLSCGSSRSSLTYIERLRGLECLTLLSRRRDFVIWNALFDSGFPTRIGSLQNLRELALGSDVLWGDVITSLVPLFRLPRLETLFLDNFAHLNRLRDDFVRLVTKHSTLRILVLTGYVGGNLQFPPRVLYGNGFNADPLPQLHIFVGKKASMNIRFPKFPSNAAKVYPINEPLPMFLNREDIKPIFEGVWIAEKIKEAAELGAKFCDYRGDLATSFRSSDT